MTASLLEGKPAAAGVRDSIKADIEPMARAGVQPSLRVVVFGEDPPVMMYAERLRKAGIGLGITVQIDQYSESTEEAEMVQIIECLNRNTEVDGVVVGMPLPSQLNAGVVSGVLDPEKDVDGITLLNAGKLYLGFPTHVPSTAASILHLLKENGIQLKGAHAVVVGRSPVVGKPATMLLLAEHATVTTAHSRTSDLAAVVRAADIVVAAVGKPELIRGTMIKPGAAVVDAGINPTDNGLVGDVAFDEAVRVAGAITPVPGGVGPLTNVLLLREVVRAAKTRHGFA